MYLSTTPDNSWQDVESELCDVIITAMVALRTLNPEAAAVFASHLDRVAGRSLGGAAGTDTTETGKAAGPA